MGDTKTQGDKISREGRTSENDGRRTVTVTYEIEVVDFSESEIEDTLYWGLDIGFGHTAEAIDLEIGEVY